MGRFTPCQGKSACRDDGRRCLTCGRTLDEIFRLRELTDQLAALAVERNYRNINEYTTYISRKLEKMITHRQQEMARDGTAN